MHVAFTLFTNEQKYWKRVGRIVQYFDSYLKTVAQGNEAMSSADSYDLQPYQEFKAYPGVLGETNGRRASVQVIVSCIQI